MEFEDWIAEARKDVDRAIKNKVHENSMISGSNYFKSKLFPHYKEFKAFKETKKLVWATWALAIVTIILAISTMIFSAVSYSQAERVLELSERMASATERTANASEIMADSIGEEGSGMKRVNASLWVVLTITLFITLVFLVLNYKIIKKRKK